MVFMLLRCFAAEPLTAATISGTVTDASGNPIKDVRIDHTGIAVVVPRPDLKFDPSRDEVRTDAEGRFRATTFSPAIVIRKPGYISQRLLITGDLQVEISLQRIAGVSQCKQSNHLNVKTKEVNDADYTATVYYIETKAGSPGILSGHGPMYSWGAPSDFLCLEVERIRRDNVRNRNDRRRGASPRTVSTGAHGASSVRQLNTRA